MTPGRCVASTAGAVRSVHPIVRRTVALRPFLSGRPTEPTGQGPCLWGTDDRQYLDRIVGHYEINEADDGQLYLVMAHYEAETPKERIERGPLELDDAIDIATQVGQGLARADTGQDVTVCHVATADSCLCERCCPAPRL